MSNISKVPAELLSAAPYTPPSVSLVDSPSAASAVPTASDESPAVSNVIPNPFTMQPVEVLHVYVCIKCSSPPPVLHVYAHHPWNPRDLIMREN